MIKFHQGEINLDNRVGFIYDDHKKQTYTELRLHAQNSEKIYLEFQPLKMSDTSDWNPQWEEWHCYSTPLRIYTPDYDLLIEYFNRIYPIKDIFTETLEPVFDVCSDHWITKEDWLKIIYEIEQELNRMPDTKKSFYASFIEWLKEALEHTSIIVVEGNL